MLISSGTGHPRASEKELREPKASDDNEPEPKTVVRRGRPPSKIIKCSIGRPTLDRAASDFSSNATLANSGDGTHLSNLKNDSARRALASESGAESARSSYNLRKTELFSWAGVSKSESNEECSGQDPVSVNKLLLHRRVLHSLVNLVLL